MVCINNMKKQMEDLFKKYIHSVLNPDEFSKLSDFLSDKTHDAAVNHEVKTLWEKQLSSGGALPETNKVLIGKIMQAIQMEEMKVAQKKIRIIHWGLRIAAVLIIGLLISTVFLFQKSRQTEIPGYVQTISIPMGAKTSFTLPDGSKVWLNSGSTLSFPSRFEENRPVTLAGEAFFEVVKNGLPFKVSTPYGHVEVMGTSFNVNATEGSDFETTLVSGSVKVTGKDEREVTLVPGQQARLSGNRMQVQQVETELFTSWIEGKLIFRKEYLPAVVKRLERWYNVKIELSDDTRLQKIWYTGTLEMESFPEVLDLLKVTASIDYTYNENTRIIKITYKLPK
jgi:transmembrane sensor